LIYINAPSVRLLSLFPVMPTYRFDFLGADGEVFAMHEIDYANDEVAVTGGLLINGDPPIGRGFQIWRDGEIIYSHESPDSEPGASGVPKNH
jgi:hypothetical protein